MKLVCLYHAPDELMANSVRDLMLQNGIGAMVRINDVLGSLLAARLVPFADWGEVLIDEQDLDRAGELLGGFLGTLGELEEAEQRPD